MVDTPNALSQESGTDLSAEWDRLDAEEAGQSPETPEAADAPTDTTDADDQGQASRPPAEPAAAKPAGNEPDIWANAPPEYRAAFEAERQRAEQAVRSQTGRAQAEARRNAELQAELAALRKEAPEPKQEDTAPAITEETKQQLRDEFPDVAAPLLDVIGQLEKQVANLASSNASQEERRQAADQLETQRVFAAEEQRLTEQHGDWSDVVKQPEFSEWVKNQPRMIKEALTRNASQIVDADEAIDIIGRYKAETAKPDALGARREAQMRGSTVPKPRAFAPTPSTSTDKESEWERLEARDRQRDAQMNAGRSNR
jgi:hypothetical protein